MGDKVIIHCSENIWKAELVSSIERAKTIKKNASACYTLITPTNLPPDMLEEFLAEAEEVLSSVRELTFLEKLN